MTKPTTPGWYRNPENPHEERLWNGRVWTNDVRRAPDAPEEIPEDEPDEEVWGGALPPKPVMAPVEEPKVATVSVEYVTDSGETFTIQENPDANPTPWLNDPTDEIIGEQIVMAPPSMGLESSAAVITTVSEQAKAATSKKHGLFRRQ